MGKTEMISCRVAHLLRLGKVKDEELLEVTFTVKAALQLTDRIHNKFSIYFG